MSEDYFASEEGKGLCGAIMSITAISVGAFIIYNSALKGYENTCQEFSRNNNLSNTLEFCSDSCHAKNLVNLVEGGLTFDEAYYTTKKRCEGKKE
ncbi:MAG: hypothetical protein KKA62_03695 [Nanoarchaeota archaeon]|nr:hypothetical protein [Nanoarchaeota archaeon]MBU1644621.1 hypothetical protein [Nanoarchaeota archaeon]MBU1977029.1 hypothetical protein [Nanoarchaeota archaeon]